MNLYSIEGPTLIDGVVPKTIGLKYIAPFSKGGTKSILSKVVALTALIK